MINPLYVNGTLAHNTLNTDATIMRDTHSHRHVSTGTNARLPRTRCAFSYNTRGTGPRLIHKMIILLY